MNSLLYGHNPRQHVIAVHQLNDRYIRLYTRTDGKIQQEDVEFFPFFFLSNPTLLQDFSKQFWLKELSGNLYYKYIAAFSRWGDMWDAVHYALKVYNKSAPTKISHYNDLESILLRPDPVNQFLSQSGTTLFKGLEFGDLIRMQIDVQRMERIPRVEPGQAIERIARIVLSDTSGWQKIIVGEDSNPKAMLTTLVSTIREQDPDVLEGHNLYGHILPSLVALVDKISFEFAIGRDGSNLKHIFPRQPYRSGEGETGFFEVAGRHLVDTQRLADTYDTPARSFESLGLEQLARQFGLGPISEPSVPVAHVKGESLKGPLKPARTHFGNVQFVQKLSEILLPSHFHLSQMCPLTLGSILRTGSASKIESLLFREYLRQKHSLPRPERGSQTRGGYTDIFYTGVFSKVSHADVEALYPSIMTSQNIGPKSDLLGVFTPILAELTEMRLDAKRKREQSPNLELRNRYDALQSAYKILINSFYGYLAYSRAHFNDYGQADRITELGQSYLRTIIDQARSFNAQVLEVDTDGLFFIPPVDVNGEAQEDLFVKRLASSLPAGINLLAAGRYNKMLSYKRKNYALMDYSGKISIRGSSLISRNLELFARKYIEQCIECLLLSDIASLHRTYTSMYRRILTHQWSAREFCKSDTIKEDLEAYEREMKSGTHSPSPPMEAAKRASLYPRTGLTILYYVTGTEANVKIADNCRVAEEWDSNLPDENTQYYLSRFGEYSAKFKDFFTPGDYERIFSTEDLFGFSPDAISIQNRELKLQKPEIQSEDTDSDFPIWLGDTPA